MSAAGPPKALAPSGARGESCRHGRARLALASAAALLAACAAGPDYRRPAVDMPVTWKIEPPWREGVPDDAAAKGPWWQRFGDPELDALEQQALGGESDARRGHRAPRAGARDRGVGVVGAVPAARPGVAARAGRRFPPTDRRPITRRPISRRCRTTSSSRSRVSYEVDLFGRVQRTVEGARASAEQSAADLENTRLVLTADLAAAYFACARPISSSTCSRARSRCSGGRSNTRRPGTTSARRPASTSRSSRRCSTAR